MASQKSSYFPAYGGTTAEQTLAQDLIDEQIKIHGSTVYYLPRTLNKIDSLFHEDTISSFDASVEIEMYLKSYDKFDGVQDDTLTRFGLKNNDALTFAVSKRRWQAEFDGNFAGKLADDRPAEGDLIYFPLTKGLFEIKYVEHQADFYQLGQFYTYDLRCELFEYSGEDLNTGVDEIDDIELERSVKTSIVFDDTASHSGTFQAEEQVVGATSGATATTVSWDGTNYILVVYDKSKNFQEGEVITGQTSNATWTMKQSTVTGSQQIETQYITDSTEDNTYNRSIESYADSILDFTEKNPFGEF